MKVLILALVAVMIAVGLFYYALNQSHAADMRREDFENRQEKLSEEVARLNATITQQLKYQEQLSAQANEIAAKADLPPEEINITRTVQPDPVIVPVVKPVVSRAS